MTAQTLTALSPAKLNLTLRVLGMRPDGFHELESLVTLVDLCDTITVTPGDDGCYALDCSDPTLPRDGSNLVLRAASALTKATGINRGVRIELTKRIPAGSGLGGGSSNAATTLRLLNQLWELGLDDARLAEIGADLGSDVPLFFHGPLCVLRGRGEQVTRVDAALDAWVAIMLPELHCATPQVYAAWDRLAARAVRPDMAQVLATLGDSERLNTLLFNDLEPAAQEVETKLRGLMARVGPLSGAPVHLTGSGAALFRVFAEEDAATSFAGDIGHALGVHVVVARTRP